MRIAIAALLALSCAGASSEMIGPNTYGISCRRSRSNCWHEAQRVCPDGFDQVDSSDHQGFVMSGNVAVPTYKGEMMVRCRERAGR